VYPYTLAATSFLASHTYHVVSLQSGHCVPARVPGVLTLIHFSAQPKLLVTTPRVPLSNRLVETQAANTSHKICSF